MGRLEASAELFDTNGNGQPTSFLVGCFPTLEQGKYGSRLLTSLCLGLVFFQTGNSLRGGSMIAVLEGGSACLDNCLSWLLSVQMFSV